MTPYDEVLGILHEDGGWPLDCAPAPVATARELASREAEEVADDLDSWVNDRADALSVIYPFDEAKRLVLHSHFAINMKFWELETQKAFGYTVDPPLDLLPEAKSISEWARNQALGRSRLGALLVDDTPEGNAEMERRKAKAADVPLEWSQEGKGVIWSLAVTEGLIPATLGALEAAYAQTTPSLAEVRFLSPQQWLDNLRIRPVPWGPDGKPAVQ